MTKSTSPSFRIISIDALRALTMVLMIFVNDLWSLTNIPVWLEHMAANEDGMGLADTVFPAFLFIVGMSIPFSVQSRRSKGETNAKILWHIVTRSFALLVVGLFLVNGEYLNEEETGMKRVVWNSLCCFSFILLWNSYPKKVNAWIIRAAKSIAIVILIVLAFVCGSGTNNVHGFQTYWWGILGLIGWAYFVTAVIFTLAEKSFTILVLAWLFFIMLCVSHHAGWINSNVAGIIIAPIGEGAMPAFVMGGVITSLIFQYFAREDKHIKLIIVLLGITILLMITGIYTRSFWGISKIRATPAWVLICSAITILLFIFLDWLTYIKKITAWLAPIKPAGNNTLLCYLLPYFAYAVVVILHFSLPSVLLTGAIGLLKSFFFSLLIVGIAGLLGKWGIRLKL